jgi:transposase
MTQIRSSASSPSGQSPRSIPPKANRKTQWLCDFALYCERNLVERFFNQLKHFRAVATRYDKLARNFLAGVQLAAAMILLN